MIQNKKIAAVCVAEMQNDDIQSILYPLNEALSEIGWRMIIFDSCTDFFLKNAFDEGEAHLFQLLNHDYIDAVLIMSRTIKNDEIQNQIINRARQNGTPVLLIDSDTRPEGTIQISFDESDAFERLVLHLVEDHHLPGSIVLRASKTIQSPSTEYRSSGKYWQIITFLLMRANWAMVIFMPSRPGR